MMVQKSKISSLIKQVHNLRVSCNNDEIGFGSDIYSPLAKKFHYDEAYALWGLGYLNLYSIENEIFSTSLLNNIMDKIIKYFDENVRYDGSFGLPWDWQGQSKNEGYLITTSFVALFLQKYNSLFDNNKINTTLSEIESYMLSLQENKNNQIYLLYSKHQRENVINAYAVAMLFLALYDYEKNLRLIDHIIDSIRDGQDETGGFVYMMHPTRKIDIPDNYHQCFILNSLIGTRNFLVEKGLNAQKLDDMINKGMDYFVLNFFDDDLYMRRHAKKPLFGSEKFHYRKLMFLRRLAKIKRKLLGQPPSKSRPNFFDYGQTLALLSTDLDKYMTYLQAVIVQSENDLNSIKPDNFYVRDMGHYFYGLTEVLIKLK